MKQPNKKPNSLREQDSGPTLQLTSRQLIVAICMLLIAACLLVLAGILVGRYEQSITADGGQPGYVRPEVPEGVDAFPAPPADGETVGEQTFPRRDVVEKPWDRPRAGHVTTTPLSDPAAPPPPRGASRQERTPSGEGLQEPREQGSNRAASAAEKPAQTSKKSSAQKSEDALPAAPTEGPAAQKREKTPKPAPEKPAEPPKKAEAETPKEQAAPSAKKTETPKPAPAVEPGGGMYVVQLIAFGADHKAQAEAYCKDLREKKGLQPELRTSEDGKYLRVYVGRTIDRAEAEALRDKLRQDKQFEKCIVKKVGTATPPTPSAPAPDAVPAAP